MNPSFAVMIPSYNGGNLLEESLRSCLVAGLDPAQVAVIVCDNRSTDGSDEAASALARTSGGLITVVRNAENLGRVGNWNRCLDVASERGARFVTFLMVGDQWLPGADPMPLTRAMQDSGASLALARYHIVDASGSRRKVGRNFIRSPWRVVPAQRFIRKALKEGALCFAPLQANVYRLDHPRRLRFDPGDPTHTDQRATLAYLGQDAESLLLWDRPYFAWKAHPSRFHMGMNVGERVHQDRAMIRSVADERGFEIDDRHINANLFLLVVREWAGRRGGLARIRDAARSFRRSPGGLAWGLAARQLFRRVVLRRFLT